MKRLPEAPAHLRPDTAAWWREVVESYVLEPHHLKILLMAATAWDRYEEAREVIEKEGLTFIDKHGQPRRHPACDIEATNKTLFARLLRELSLDLEPPAPSRPPGRPGTRR